jgi:putative protease
LLVSTDEERRKAMSNGERIGEVTHFYNKISVAVVKLSQDLAVGDSVHFLGRHTDYQQEITSMQIEHQPMTDVKAGDEVAIKVKQRVRRGDTVFRLTEE